jgi:hypothetical protein
MFGIFKGHGLLAARLKRGSLQVRMRKAHPEIKPKKENAMFVIVNPEQT